MQNSFVRENYHYNICFRREREVKKNNLVSKMVLGMKKKRKKLLMMKDDDIKIIQGTHVKRPVGSLFYNAA